MSVLIYKVECVSVCMYVCIYACLFITDKFGSVTIYPTYDKYSESERALCKIVKCNWRHRNVR